MFVYFTTKQFLIHLIFSFFFSIFYQFALHFLLNISNKLAQKKRELGETILLTRTVNKTLFLFDTKVKYIQICGAKSTQIQTWCVVTQKYMDMPGLPCA